MITKSKNGPCNKHARKLYICAWFLNLWNALIVREIQYVQKKTPKQLQYACIPDAPHKNYENS